MVGPSTGKLEHTLVTMVSNIGFSLGTVSSGVNPTQVLQPGKSYLQQHALFR